MRLLHFTGEGYGMMVGVDEFVVLTSTEGDPEDFGAPGFILCCEAEVVGGANLPEEETLVRRG